MFDSPDYNFQKVCVTFTRSNVINFNGSGSTKRPKKTLTCVDRDRPSCVCEIYIAQIINARLTVRLSTRPPAALLGNCSPGFQSTQVTTGGNTTFQNIRQANGTDSKKIDYKTQIYNYYGSVNTGPYKFKLIGLVCLILLGLLNAMPDRIKRTPPKIT